MLDARERFVVDDGDAGRRLDQEVGGPGHDRPTGVSHGDGPFAMETRIREARLQVAPQARGARHHVGTVEVPRDAESLEEARGDVATLVNREMRAIGGEEAVEGVADSVHAGAAAQGEPIAKRDNLPERACDRGEGGRRLAGARAEFGEAPDRDGARDRWDRDRLCWLSGPDADPHVHPCPGDSLLADDGRDGLADE